MKIISISGLDGSGKTSQIQMLKNELEKNGQKVFYFHAVEFSIGNKILQREARNKTSASIETAADKQDTNKCQKSNVKCQNQPKAVTSSRAINIFLRKIALIVDIFRFKSLHVKLSAEYDYILTDRYFYDQIVNILFLENAKPNSSNQPWWFKIAEKHIIKPDATIYLKVDPDVILQRDRQIEQGREYLEKKKLLYNNLAQRWEMMIVDGNSDKNEVYLNLKSLLKLT